jgi:hypothetical protein
MQKDYWKNTPLLMQTVLVFIGLLALFPLGNLFFLGIKHLELGFAGEISLSGLGLLGDFFGGHTAAFAGSLSLLAVLFFSYHQARQQAHFFQQQAEGEDLRTSRAFFLEGVGLITQWDIASPGSDQCLRLLDYYGRLALTSNDRELVLILNTVVTAQIRANLQGKNGSFKKTNYPFACEALERIAELRKEDGLAMRDRREKARAASNLSTPQVAPGGRSSTVTPP